MAFETIRKYLGYLAPGPAPFGPGSVTSLREITGDDVRAALGQRPGHHGPDLATALRSLFRALKQERLIFRDPTRGITIPAVARLPVPIPTDRLRGLIDRAGGAMAKLAVALVAIHGLGARDNSSLLLDDLDLPDGTLRCPPGLRRGTPSTSTSSPAPSWLPGCANDSAAGPAPPTATCWSASRPPSRTPAPVSSYASSTPIFWPARPQPVQTPAGPHPRRGQAHRRPRPPHARVRHLRRHRDEVRLRCPPRTPVDASPVVKRPPRTPLPDPPVRQEPG